MVKQLYTEKGKRRIGTSLCHLDPSPLGYKNLKINLERNTMGRPHIKACTREDHIIRRL